MNFLFIHIHKCAGTSIKDAISKIDNVHYGELHETDRIRFEISEKYYDHKIFTFVRNPYSRFLSAFEMFRRRWPDIKKEQVFKIVENDDIPYSADFFNVKESYIKRHTLPMTSEHYSIYDSDGNCNVDLILRFEEMDKEVERLSLFLGTKIKMPKKNVSKNKDALLTMEDKLRINKIYKKDFEVFKYRLELE